MATSDRGVGAWAPRDGPALAGNVGARWAFALPREGDQDVDVPMLAPARSRCRFGYGESRGFALGDLGLRGGSWVLEVFGAGAWGWCVGSAGSVLRSQGTLGPAGLSRYRARGSRVSTFLCSLRPGPAAALFHGESRGFALGSLGFGGYLGFLRSLGLARGVGAWVGAWARSRCRWGCRCCGDKRGRRVSGKNLSVGL